MDEFTLSLNTPLAYDHDGQRVEADHLVFKAPTALHLKLCSKIGQAVVRGAMEMSNKIETTAEVKSGDDTPSGEMYISAVMAAESVDFDKFTDMMQTLFISKVCYVDGKEPLTALLFKQLPLDSFMEAMGLYLENFPKSFLPKSFVTG